MVFCPEHPKQDQNLNFTPLSETTSILASFIGEPPPPFLNPRGYNIARKPYIHGLKKIDLLFRSKRHFGEN